MKKIWISVVLALNGCSGGSGVGGNDSDAALNARAQALSDQANLAVEAQVKAIEAASTPITNAPPTTPPASSGEAQTK